MGMAIESIRAFAAENDGQLPESLEGLSLPAPVNPITGKPIEYKKEGQTATLIGSADDIIYQLILTINDPN